MPELYLPGAIKHLFTDAAPCDQTLPPKAIPHITADRSATRTNPISHVSFESLVSYFTQGGKSKAPHILWDPFTGQFAQFYTPQSRSKSLFDGSDPLRTNRAGKVVIQIEAVFFPWTLYKGVKYEKLSDTPGKNWKILQDWLYSWGVPNRWPGGKPTSLVRDTMTVSEYKSAAGYISHAQVPDGNTHVDPGSWFDFVVASVPPAHVPPFPGAQFFKVGVTSNHTVEVDQQLIRLHFTKHHAGKSYTPGPYYSENTRLNVQDFQKSLGWTGKDADGLVGPVTWNNLHSL